jgi:hypothetical protein
MFFHPAPLALACRINAQPSFLRQPESQRWRSTTLKVRADRLQSPRRPRSHGEHEGIQIFKKVRRGNSNQKQIVTALVEATSIA